MEERENLEEDCSVKKYNISCCRSYLTPKGRCYTCPELEDEFGEEADQKDPDEEKW